jgi:hypothetical protein
MRKQILTLLVVSLVAGLTTQAFAQAGEGDANFAAGGYAGGGYGMGGYGMGGYGVPGLSGAYGAYDPYSQGYAWEPEARTPRIMSPRRPARSSARNYSN